MKAGSRKMKSFKNRLRRRITSRKLSMGRVKSFVGGRRTRYRHHRQRGGYSQYQNNMPMTPTYSVGGILPASQLALANPPPVTVLPNCTNCIDNYSHFTGKGFPSRGH